MRVAVFGAHPDDQELGMGGTVARLASCGHSVTLVDLTDGEPTPFGTREIRAAESKRAAEILGALRMQLGLTNRQVVNDLASRAVVASAIRRLRPDLIFAPHPTDAHPDHVAASALIDAARFSAKFTNCDLPGEPWHSPRMFYYYSIHLKSLPNPSVIAHTAGFSATKQAAILAYASQFVTNPANRGVPQWLQAADAYFGSRIGKESGEPFYSRECVEFDFAAV